MLLPLGALLPVPAGPVEGAAGAEDGAADGGVWPAPAGAPNGTGPGSAPGGMCAGAAGGFWCDNRSSTLLEAGLEREPT